MHEVGLMENALAIALEYAQRDQASHIHKIRLRIGTLSGVDPDALRFAFDVVTQNTIAEAALLEIESCPTQCFCRICNQSFEPKSLGYECPVCETWSSHLLQGRELELASLEVS